MSSTELEQTLSKIRPHESSNLPHQKAPASLLRALEATLDDQKTERTPTAYYAVIITALEGTLQKERTTGLSLGEGDVLPAELYLLALVAQHVPHPVIRANLSTLLSLTAPLFPHLANHAPALRSQLTVYGAVFLALDRPHLEVAGIKQSFASVLQLCVDPRPKVRRKAVEVVRDLLSTPPSPMVLHPYAERVAEWVQASLASAAANPIAKGKGKKVDMDGSDTAIHLLAFLRLVMLKLPPAALPTITTHLLSLPRLGNSYLSQSAYSLLSDLLSNPSSDAEGDISSQIPNILKAVLSSLPSRADIALAPAWLLLVGHTCGAHAAADPDASAKEVGRVWKVVWNFLESGEAATRQAAAQSLALLTKCFTLSLVSAAVAEAPSILSGTEPKSAVGRIVVQVSKALDALATARAVPELLAVIASLIEQLHVRPDGPDGKTAAELLLLPLVEKIATLRIQKSFEYKEDADTVLSTAMKVLGPEVLLERLPLNLEPSDRQAGKEPRAFLLPLLPQPHPSPLAHFVSYFVPLSERMFEYQSTAEMEDRQAEAKVWSVLISQIWAGLVGYCYATPDLPKALTPEFSQLLSQLLYGQPELRPSVLKALRILVESNVTASSPKGEDAAKTPSRAHLPSPALAEKNAAFLRTQAESWLAVLFNVFGSVDRNARATIGDVISAWASITSPTDITKAYQNVITLFKQNLANPRAAPEGQGNVASVTQDLLLTLLPYLSAADAQLLFDLCSSSDVLGHSDNGVQKRGYKTLARLIESGKVQPDAEKVLQTLDERSDTLLAAAKKDRFGLLSEVVQRLPGDKLSVLPGLIPETVLGTKEPSERARAAAFELVVVMARKMREGGVVRRPVEEGDEMADDATEETPASLEEYVTMIAGGLAGATPHMISATVTALSRIVFEFKDEITPDMHTEILTTLLVFLSSANREIVKSTLGYIKLVVHTLPVSLVQPHLPALVPALLRWAHDHKNHFKPKVRHVFERMIRRFGFNDVYSCAGEEEARKVLVNIKKRKERAKRKKAAAAEEDEDDLDAPAAKAATGDAFEDVLYGSESELDESDDEGADGPGNAPKKKAQGGARLRVDDDEPMDLLQGAASRLINARADKRRKPGQDAARFKTDNDTGKMVIDKEDSDSDTEPAAWRPVTEDVEGTAYREAITSADGFTRGANGRVKFNKDTKKRRRENAEMEDIEMGDVSAPATTPPKKAKRNAEPRLGYEFKAKKAGGDVKKGGVDPYAYLSLSQAAKKKTGKGRGIGIAGKR